jgi:ABC-type phosphate transport system auxiliary subunit
MKITKKELALIDEWVELHQNMEKLEDKLDTLAQKLKKINIKSKLELEEFRDFLVAETKKLNKKTDKAKIGQLSSLKTIIEHDINIDHLVEQDIDIEEKGIKIDLKDYKKR